VGGMGFGWDDMARSHLERPWAPGDAVAPASVEDLCPSNQVSLGSAAALADDLFTSCQCRRAMLADSEVLVRWPKGKPLELMIRRCLLFRVPTETLG
jgi:hypothetical protein